MHTHRHIFTQQSASNRRVAAFTLLEVMVALVIVAMIATALFAALTVAFKARKSAMNNLTNLRQLRFAMETVGRDIQTILPPTGVLAGAFYATPADPSENLDTLELFNAAPAARTMLSGADIQKVVLKVMAESEVQGALVDVDLLDARNQGQRLGSADQEGSDMVLVRRVTRQLLAQVTPEPPYQIIARHVQTFRVRLYDGVDWLDTWDSTTTENTLPQAIEVTLEIKEPLPLEQTAASNSAQRIHTMTRVFQIPAYAAAASEASSTSDAAGRQAGQ